MGRTIKRPLILVTGASGMLGKALVQAAGEKYETLGVSRRPVPGGIVCDLSEPAQMEMLFEQRKFSLVVHSAAFSDVDGCERDPKAAYESNTLSAKWLSSACAARRIPWIYVSTDYVFDGRTSAPYSEKDSTGPINIYGLTKWLGEFYASTGQTSSAIVRTSWLFGADNPQNFVNAIARRLVAEKKVSVLDDQTSSPTNVKDLSMALLKIGEHLMSRGDAWHEIFQVCNRGTTTRYDMTVCMKEWLDLKDVTVEKTDRSQIKNRIAVRPSYSAMSARHYEDYFQTSLRPWQESLKEYLKECPPCAS